MIIFNFIQADVNLIFHVKLNTIYFDNNATTRVDDEVIESMIPYFTTSYGNPASTLHPFGWEVSERIKLETEKIANIINCDPGEIVYTSGATQAINVYLKCLVSHVKNKIPHIISCLTEHPAVIDTLNFLRESNKAEITYLGVDREGRIDLQELEANIKPTTEVVCIMAANNETGVLQDIVTIGEICNERGIKFFTDATQFVGKMKLDLSEVFADGVAFSAHKFHGPKGIGVLRVKNEKNLENQMAFQHGGWKQKGLLAGTLNVPGIIGLAKAMEIFDRDYWEINSFVSKIKNQFEHQLLDIPELRINGSTRYRIYNTSNITFPSGINLRKAVMKFAFSSGSACASKSDAPSHVLKSMGVPERDIKNSFRFSFSKYNSEEEVKEFVSFLRNSPQ